MLASDGKSFIIALSILTPLSTLFLGLRLSKKRKLIGIDDWLLCFALVLMYLQTAGGVLCTYILRLLEPLIILAHPCGLVAVKGGEGKQMKDLTPSELTWLFKVCFWTSRNSWLKLISRQMEYWPELNYTICIAIIKLSVLISYNTIFGRLKWFRYAVLTLGTLTSIWFLGVFFSVLFQCTPVDKAWQPTKPGHCIAFKPFLWGNSISNTLLDWSILLLPVAPVVRLQMGTVQKTLVLASFSLGSL